MTNRDYVRAWREKHRKEYLGRSAARTAALARLSDLYPRVFRRFYEEECAVRGVIPASNTGRPGKGQRRKSA